MSVMGVKFATVDALVRAERIDAVPPDVTSPFERWAQPSPGRSHPVACAVRVKGARKPASLRDDLRSSLTRLASAFGRQL